MYVALTSIRRRPLVFNKRMELLQVWLYCTVFGEASLVVLERDLVVPQADHTKLFPAETNTLGEG